MKYLNIVRARVLGRTRCSTMTSNSGMISCLQIRRCARSSKNRLVKDPWTSAQIPANSACKLWRITSICTRHHMTFVSTRPRLQQSVMRKMMGTWKTECAFRGSTSLSNSAPSPSGMSTNMAPSMAMEESVQISMCMNLRCSRVEARAVMTGSASASFTAARIVAEKTTMPRLKGKKSDTRLACAVSMWRTSTLPRDSGSASIRTMPIQESTTNTLPTRTSCGSSRSLRHGSDGCSGASSAG
mmetsp:Transcript_73019/g.225588  ORF Transcript_73019/g.225588 Transcript_73019/m.225588 type:complete len:242 (+) Transcript_73019:73-798(+)